MKKKKKRPGLGEVKKKETKPSQVGVICSALIV
jgi:hypothetical protein